MGGFERRFYVYELVDPRDGSVFYIGKGKGRRVAAHEAEARGGKQSRKCDRIREIWGDGLQVQRRIVKHFDSEVMAYDFEAKRTIEVGLENLTNEKLGGHGGRRMTSVDIAVHKAREAFWCLSRWNKIGRPLWVQVPGHGAICLDEMLNSFGRKIQAAIDKAGFERVADLAGQFGVSIEVEQ